jgi:hypothetical protein
MRWIVAVVAVAALWICPPLHAQSTSGQVNGHVVDVSGAAVAGASVSLVDVQTGLVRNAATNSVGQYIFPLVAPGEYKLSVSKTGFSTEDNPHFRLDVNQSVTQDFTLKVGAATETVTVSTNTELIDATSATLGTVVESRPVSDLPLNGRNFTALLTLAPGVDPVNYSQNGGVGYGTNQIAVGLPSGSYVYPATQGQWNRENIYYLDGVINTGGVSSTYDIPPIIDAVQEFKILSHNDNAEFGGVLGGVVNIVTKSGTNGYHGTGWEYARNNIFDSRNPFTDFDGNGNPAPPATFHQNEYGGSVGGPVRIPKLYNGKDKTFFFVAYEGWRYSKAAGATYIAPTAAELSGDFTASSIGQNELYNPFTTAGTAGNYTRQVLGDGYHVPSNLIDTTAQAFLTDFGDTPNIPGAAPGHPNTLLNAVGTDDANELNIRVDQNFGSKTTLWGRYSSLDGANTSPLSHHLQAVNSADNRNYGGGVTHVFRPNLFLDATFGYSGRFNAVAKNQPVGVTSDALALYSTLQQKFGLVDFTLNGGYNGVGGLGPIGSVSHEINFAVNTTWIKGRHQIRFGFEEQIPQLNQGTSAGVYGLDQFSFAADETSDPQNSGATGNALASALLGIPDSARFQTEVNGSRVVAPAAYIQDTWRATPKLTLNGGLRWDGESSPHLLFNTVAAMMDPNTGNWLISGGKLPPACNPAGGVYAPCIPVADPATNAILAEHVVAAPNPNLGPDPTYRNLGPRFGIAYKVLPTMVVHGGYSMTYDTITGGIQSVRDRLFSWPYNASFAPTYNTLGQPIQTMSTIVPGLSNTNALPATPTPFTGIGWYYDPHLKNPYSHQFNLEVQKELSSSLVASVAYVGSIDRHLPVTGKANNSPDPGGAGLDRPFPWAQTQLEGTSRGASNFNAMEARIDKHLAKGIAFGTGLTWSKGMDNAAGGLYDVESGPQGFAEFQNYNNINANYGISANSLKFIYYGWGIAELPFGKGKQFLTSGVGSAILGGWQFNANISAHSGAPLGFQAAGGDFADIGDTLPFFGSIRPNVSGSPKLPHPNKNAAFNTAVFSDPVNSYGNSGRGLLTSTPYDNVDFSLMRGFKIGERANIQVRPEFFNVFNIQNYGLPGTTLNGGGFGIVSGLASGATPRQIQLSIRGSF